MSSFLEAEQKPTKCTKIHPLRPCWGYKLAPPCQRVPHFYFSQRVLESEKTYVGYILISLLLVNASTSRKVPCNEL